jgi:hypothetical protein
LSSFIVCCFYQNKKIYCGNFCLNGDANLVVLFKMLGFYEKKVENTVERSEIPHTCGEGVVRFVLKKLKSIFVKNKINHGVYKIQVPFGCFKALSHSI